MKKVSIYFLVFLMALPAMAQNHKKINSKIESVTVFLQGAQINRKAVASLTKGRKTIVFSGLSRYVSPSSVQIKGEGAVTILAVSYQTNYLKKPKVSERIKEMQDSVKMLKSQYELQSKMYQALEQESQMILANKSIGSQNAGVDAAKLEQMANFFRKRLQEIYTKMYRIKEDNQLRQNEIRRLQQQIQQSQQNYQKVVGEIIVDVNVKQNTNAKFDISYQVQNAGWYPQYDIRAKDVHHPVELHYRAMIHQNTGVAWKNVKLKVSTGNPSDNNTYPTIYPWYLSYYSGSSSRNNNVMWDYALDVQEVAPVMAEDEDGSSSVGTYRKAESKSKSLEMNNSSKYTTLTNNQTASIYEISIPYTIASSNKTVNVKISKKMLDADYRYYSIPKLSPYAFLQALISGWDNLNLLPGTVNIFFEGTFVGKSRINPANIEDTLSISLGKDPSIVVQRTKIADKSGSAVLGGSKKVNVGWTISIRNGKKEKINLLLMDQIPLSRDKEIEVTLNNSDSAVLDKETGFLKWELEIAPGSKVSKSFDYTLKYPKKYTVPVQW